MKIELPPLIAAYFEADKNGDAGRVAECFAVDAVVKDGGHTYNGRNAIADWKAVSDKKFTYSCTPIKIDHHDDKDIVTGHLVGDFPGSPVDLRFIFKLEGDKITDLEIIP